MKLLLIDDDKIDRMNAKRNLKQSGHAIEITEASSAQEGLELSQNENFDLILLDYQLPTMTGLELLVLLRKGSKNSTAVVMLSHSEDEELALRCLESGAQDFITKAEVTASRLIRSILHAKERFRIELELRDSHEKLRKLAEMDTLTGLANRYMFETGLKRALPHAERHGRSLALLMLDLDKFKNVNDTLGHAVGDQLLIEAARRLEKSTREGDLLCRLGGDEFAILIHDLSDITQVQRLTSRIFTAFKEPADIEGNEIIISVSIGIASYPECAEDPIQLMKCADVAMYRSKEAGRNQSHFYSKSLHEQIQNRIELERDLHRAIEREELILYYQPQVDGESEKIVSVEALIRWQHPTKGMIPPNDFISIAEDIHIINEIGDWVLHKACSQFQEWRQQYSNLNLSLSVAVNVSALQLGQKNFVARIKLILLKYQIPPECLELELTESALTKDDAATEFLQELSDYGVKLALDDFGTGYSSLAQLQKYPFQVLKIDKSFIQSILDHNGDALFLKAINAFAKTLNLQVVAEGVETEVQKSWCKKLKFNRIQGFYFAKPMPAKELELRFLKTEVKDFQ